MAKFWFLIIHWLLVVAKVLFLHLTLVNPATYLIMKEKFAGCICQCFLKLNTLKSICCQVLQPFTSTPLPLPLSIMRIHDMRLRIFYYHFKNLFPYVQGKFFPTDWCSTGSVPRLKVEKIDKFPTDWCSTNLVFHLTE